MILPLLILCADIVIAPVPQNDANKYILFVKQGTNEFVEVSQISTNEVFRITKPPVNTIIQYYIVAVDSDGNSSDPSDIVTIKPRVRKPRAVTHAAGFIVDDHIITKTNLSGLQRQQMIVGSNNKIPTEKIIELPPPPIP